MPEDAIKYDFEKLRRTLAILVALWLLIISFNYLPDNEFAFRPTPQGGHSGGVNSVYMHEDFERCGEHAYSNEILQFYEDGIVL